MVELREFVEWLDKEIEITSVPDKCVNGLQVEGKSDIKNVGVCVDLTLGVLNKAIEQKCDMLVSHHALFWEPLQEFKGLLAKKLQLIMKNDLSVYTAHLPLDIHKRYSHGRLITNEIGMHGVSRFGLDGDPKDDKNYFGFSGNLRKKLTIEELKELVDKKLSTNSRTFPYGTKEISSVAIVSGGGGFALEEAWEKKLDCYITGEMKDSRLLDAKDFGINIILAGHSETEKLGLIKLSQSITKKFKTQCFFFDS